MNNQLVKVLVDISTHNGTRFTEVDGWVCMGYKLGDNHLFYICDNILCLSIKFYVNKEGYYISKSTVDIGKIKEDIKDQAKYLKGLIAKLDSISILDYLTSNNFRKANESNGNTYVDLHLTEPVAPYKLEVNNDNPVHPFQV